MRRKCFGIVLLITLIVGIFSLQSTEAKAAGAVSKWGRLSVKGNGLVNQSGKKVQLKGVSTHGIAWFGQYVNKAQFQSWKKMGANTIRLALYSDKNAGYDRSYFAKVEEGISYATKLGMYVVIDWHILADGNPKKNQKEAVVFFTAMAKKYAKHKNIIYEICNEPNGNVTWEKDVRPYANKLISVIRKYDKNNVIVVGTPTWSQDVDVAAEKPLKQKNIMYALHFYAATHSDWNRNKLLTALKKGLPIFVSEFSICEASGNGRLDKKEAAKWMKLIRKYKLPYIGWNISNKAEASALLKSSCRKTGKITKKNLSASGKWLVKQFAK